jgi:hypothetical protein
MRSLALFIAFSLLLGWDVVIRPVWLAPCSADDGEDVGRDLPRRHGRSATVLEGVPVQDSQGDWGFQITALRSSDEVIGFFHSSDFANDTFNSFNSDSSWYNEDFQVDWHYQFVTGDTMTIVGAHVWDAASDLVDELAPPGWNMGTPPGYVQLGYAIGTLSGGTGRYEGVKGTIQMYWGGEFPGRCICFWTLE